MGEGLCTCLFMIIIIIIIFARLGGCGGCVSAVSLTSVLELEADHGLKKKWAFVRWR